MTEVARPNDAHPFAVVVRQVVGIVPALGIEGRGRVQIAEHAVLGPYPQCALGDLGFNAFAGNLHPKRVPFP